MFEKPFINYFNVPSNWWPILVQALLLMSLAGNLPAQDLFSSGSTGADGALEFTAVTGTAQGESVYDSARGVVVLVTLESPVLGTWEYDGQRWTRKTPGASPPYRNQFALAYDSTRNVTVLFGGNNGSTLLNDTWEYNGATWTQRTPAASPALRYYHRMTFDDDRDVTVLFGGYISGSQFVDDTWEYNGTTWTEKVTNDSPPDRYSYGMAYDTQRNVTVVFGGYSSVGYRNDTWEYNGTNWVARNPVTKPSPRYVGAFVFDSFRNVIVLWGGLPVTGYETDTWEYNGTNWTEKVTADSPPPFTAGGMSYDSIRQRSVLNSIYAGSSHTWEYDGTNWSAPIHVQQVPIIDMAAKPEGIWNYTTITVGPGVTVRFKKNAGNTPVVWLASGDVSIVGAVDVSGSNGSGAPTPANIAKGGPGGFDGGLGGVPFNVSNSYAGTPGQGPGGGLPGTAMSETAGNAGHSAAGSGPLGGPEYGNPFCVPLVGGSGGGGSGSTTGGNGYNGGGGGGAILIASSTVISVTGQIVAYAGSSIGNSGYGSGGAIRLVANRIRGNGTISAWPNGRVRQEAFFRELTTATTPPSSFAPPIPIDLDAVTPGAIQITQVAGEAVPVVPTGDLVNPDVVFSQAGQITINFATTHIPQGTVLSVRVAVSGQVLMTDSTPVNASGDASATLTVPAGVGTIQAYASYTVSP